MAAKKSAPSRRIPSPPLRPRPPNSLSTASLEDQLTSIEKWGVNQFEGCLQCKTSGQGNQCFVAEQISSRCGNCLRDGKTCQFSRVRVDEVYPIGGLKLSIGAEGD